MQGKSPLFQISKCERVQKVKVFLLRAKTRASICLGQVQTNPISKSSYFKL